MAKVRIGGGMWVPTIGQGLFGATQAIGATDMTVDADEEEIQLFGSVYLAAGSGSKTFGTSGSALGWMVGASITFASGSTLRVGVKQASQIATATGPSIRATIGAAAFDVYDDLVGGTDTITATTWREDAMSAGTPFTVNHGDLIAVCFHLDTSSGTPSVKVRGFSAASGAPNNMNMPTSVLVTAGPAHTVATQSPMIVFTFDDGTLGWLDPTFVYSASGTETIGNTNLFGNQFTPTANIWVDAIAMQAAFAGTTNADFGLMSDPAGTPAFISNASFSIDPQQIGNAAGANRVYTRCFSQEIALTASTAYAIAMKQNSATALTVPYWDVNATGHQQVNGLDANCFCVKSTAGAAFASQNSGKRRAAMWMRVSSIEDGAASGGLAANPIAGFVA